MSVTLTGGVDLRMRGRWHTHSVLSLSDSLNSLPQNHPPTLITSALKI